MDCIHRTGFSTEQPRVLCTAAPAHCYSYVGPSLPYPGGGRHRGTCLWHWTVRSRILVMQFQSHVRFIESSPLLKLMVMLFGVASVMDVHGGEIAAWTATTRWPPASFTECLVTSGGFRGVPAAASAVASLPETTVTAGGDGEETSCAVCLEGYTASDALRTMPCAHTFHPSRGCIVRRLDGDHGRSGTALRCRERRRRGQGCGGADTQTVRPAEPRERRPWWMHALAAAGSSQGGKVDDRDAAALRQAEEGDPGADGGHYFEYRPPWGRTVFQIPSAPGPCRPFDEDCAVQIIRKSPPISHRFPVPSPSPRRDRDGRAWRRRARCAGASFETERIHRMRCSSSPCQRLITAIAASGRPCRVRAAGFASGRFGGMPAAARAVARLPVPETTVTAGGAGEETCCAVCLEGCAAGDALRTVPCAHTFHEDASWTGSPSAASARWRRRTPPANTHRRQAWDR